MYGIFLWGGKIFLKLIVVMVEQFCEHIVHFQYILCMGNFVVCELSQKSYYLKKQVFRGRKFYLNRLLK